VDTAGKRYGREQSPRVDFFGTSDGKMLEARKGGFPCKLHLH